MLRFLKSRQIYSILTETFLSRLIINIKTNIPFIGFNVTQHNCIEYSYIQLYTVIYSCIQLLLRNPSSTVLLKALLKKTKIDELMLTASEESPELFENILKFSNFEQPALNCYNELIQQKLAIAEQEHEVQYCLTDQ